MTLTHFTRAVTAALLGLAAFGLAPTRASGGGGLFCDRAAPVNQQAERIIFSKNADGTATAIVQLQYIGPSGRFAWVLPVPGTPYIGVSSNIVFSQLQARTNPQFTLNTTVEGARRRSQGRLRGQLFGCHRRGHGCRCRHRPPPVIVLDRGSVGPFDYVTISLDPSLPAPADAAVTWLMGNGYDVDATCSDPTSPTA